MDFRISDTFTDSLARLTGEEQKTAPRIAFGLASGLYQTEEQRIVNKKYITDCFIWCPGTESNRRHEDFQSSLYIITHCFS